MIENYFCRMFFGFGQKRMVGGNVSLPPLERILIIEDNPESQLLFQIILKNFYKLDAVYNAEDGIGFIKNKKIDLILLDINLPGKLDGVDVLKFVKGNEEYSNVKIIVLTAYSLKGDEKKFIELGANAYLSKPVSKKILLDTVHKIINS